MQSKIINAIKAAAAARNLEVTVQHNWSNTGTMYITPINSFDTVTTIDFWIYTNYASFVIRTRGVLIETKRKTFDKNTHSFNYEDSAMFDAILTALVASWEAPVLQDLSNVIDSVAV